MKNKYDYIFAGAGLSGLLIALEIINTPSLKNKKVLLIDRNAKKENDRTWCFWNDESFEYNHLVCKEWDKIRFSTTNTDALYEISPYRYKYIRGIDFYSYAKEKIREQTSFEELTATISEVSPTGYVVADGITYEGGIIFNSIHPSWENFSYPKKECYHVLQHFKGYFIKTESDYFDEHSATFMDFSIEQYQEARFGYVLPFSKREALIEYTLFSQNLLTKEAYEEHLQRYISETLGIKKYTILHDEFGIVPMSTYSYEPKIEGKIIRIGTYGGFVKPSSGFAFSRTYKRSKKIVRDLALYQKIHPSTLKTSFKYTFYDKIVLSIIEKNPEDTKNIFEKMFTKIDAKIILKFLDEESTLWEDLRIMSLFITDKRFLLAPIRELSRLIIK